MPGNKYTDKNVLMSKLVWVLYTYPDNSEFCFQTTLSPDILRERGVVLEEGHLVRLDKMYYIGGQMVYRQFPYQGVVISLWDALTYTDERSMKMHPFF